MAVSGTTTFSYTRDQIIQFAMRKLGILELGATPDSDIVNNFSDSLNLIIKSLITRGIKLWTIQELTLPLVSSKTTYVIGPSTSGPITPDLVADKPMKLMQAWLRNVSVSPQNDIPLEIISQHNYNEFGSKFSTGTSNSVYLEVGREQSTMKMYLTPDIYASQMYQLHFLTQRPLYDVVSSIDTLDVPIEWMYALGWLIAEDSMFDFGVPPQRQVIISAKAQDLLSKAEDYDIENNSIYFTPDARYRQTYR